MKNLVTFILVGLVCILIQDVISQDFGQNQIIGTSTAGRLLHTISVDLDDDGDMDVITASSGWGSSEGGEVIWFRNLGDGSFEIGEMFVTNQGAIKAYGIDMDGDDDKDIVWVPNIISTGNAKIYWYENDGNENFNSTRTISTSINFVEDMVFHDIDGDGDKDIALTSSWSTYADLIWHENYGNGNFSSSRTIKFDPEVGGKGLFIADLNNDGDAAIALISFENGGSDLSYFEYEDGSWGAEYLVDSNVDSRNVYCADLDGDDDQDIVTSIDDKSIYWYKNDGTGEFGSRTPITIGNSLAPQSITTADLDLDGDLDLVLAISAAGQVGRIVWHENDGNGNFGNERLITIDLDQPNFVYAGDIDNDNDLDIVTADQINQRVIWNENMINYSTFKSVVFYDLNGNGEMDGTERGVSNIPFQLSPIDQLLYSNGLGCINSIISEGINNLEISHDENIWSLTTTYNQVDLSQLEEGDTLLFGLLPIVNVNDITLNITSCLPRCNTEVPSQIILTNTGTTIIEEGTLETTNIELIEYIVGSANPAPYNINGDQLSWDFADLYPGESFTVNLNFEIDGPPDISVGDSLCLNAIATIQTEANEETTYNPPTSTGETDLVNICHCTGAGINPYVVLELPYSAVDGQGNYDHANHGCDIIPITDLNNDGNIDELDCLVEQTSYTETTFLGSYKSEIRCSFDPNDKAANPAGESDENWTLMGQDIIYTIRFQNTGNDTAFQVELIDTLSEHLNISTFDFITASHQPVDITIESVPNQEEKVLKFLFEDILLPDSTVDLVGSNGFVQFSIRPKFGLPDETIITNDAGIYFDFNPPVITNLVDHTLVYTIPDYRAPEANCKASLEVALDENGNASITADQIDLASTDNVGIESLELDQTTFTCSNLGSNSIQLTVFDAAGNSDVCETNVIVIDEELPEITCQNFSINLDENGNVMLLESDVVLSKSDNCSIENTTLSQTSFGCNDIGTKTIEVDVKDASENTADCSVEVEVKDEIKPTVVCKDIMLTIQEGETITLTPEEVTTTLSDNCGIQSSVLSQATFSQSDVGNNAIDLTVTDASDNQTICPINVEITVVSNVLESVYGIEATIAPNPFSDYTVLNFSKRLPFNFDVKIVDITGKVIQEYLNQDQQHVQIENENWSSGIYMLNVFEVGKDEILGSFRVIRK